MRVKTKTLTNAYAKVMRQLQRIFQHVLFAVVYTAYISRRALHHAGHRPHQHLTKRFDGYRRWHEWQHHKRVHVAALATYLVLVISFVVINFSTTFATDISNSWNFSNGADFQFDNTKIETSGSSERPSLLLPRFKILPATIAKMSRSRGF